MSESIEAAALANWLESPEQGQIPEGIPADVAEAIVALRPELAPPFSAEIEDILATLTDGPLVDPVVAKALRTWLAAGPGAEPPPTLPVGVVEAAYALRPELAPSLGLNIDDILDAVEHGPLSAQPEPSLRTPNPATETEPIQSVAKIAMLSTRRRWWTGTAVTATAVAATALLVVAPVTEEATMSPHIFTDNQSAQAESITRVEPSVSLLQDHRESLTLQPNAIKNDVEPKPTPAARGDRPSPTIADRQRARGVSVSTAERVPPPSRKPAAARSAPKAMREVPMDDGVAVTASTPIEDASSDQINPEIDDLLDATTPALMHGMVDREEGPSAEAPPASSEQATRLDLEVTGIPAGFAQGEGVESRSAADGAVMPSAESGNATRSGPSRRGDSTATGAVERGRKLLEAGRLEEALSAVENGLGGSSIDPITAARLWRLKAQILTKLGRETEAQQARKKAATIDPLR